MLRCRGRDHHAPSTPRRSALLDKSARIAAIHGHKDIAARSRLKRIEVSVKIARPDILCGIETKIPFAHLRVAGVMVYDI